MTDDPNNGGRRYSDEMLFRLDERIKMHIDWAQKKTSILEERIKEIENWQKGVETPVHYAGVIMLSMVLAFVGAIGTWIWKLISRIHIG